jgi:hypothetical protein
MDLAALKAIGFCDMRLWAVRWESDGRDVVLAIELGDGTRADLRCTWATDVLIDIGKRGQGGSPLSWDGSIVVTGDGRHDVSFDFAGDGKLSLKCNEVLVAVR